MELSFADIGAAAQMAQKVDPNPLRLAGRFIGMSGDESGAKIPAWGWVTVGLGLGFLGGVFASRSDFLRERLGGG